MPAFNDFAARKIREAQTARICPLETVEDRSDDYPLDSIGSDWTRALYDGPFHLHRVPPDGPPAVSLVFVQSRDGNTGAENPADLGAGDSDKHLIYEGLSRVAADGVLAGATTANSPGVFFSVWHPQLVALRAALGLPRHPAQVIVTGRACIDVDTALVLNVPSVAAFVLATPHACAALDDGLKKRPWVEVVPIEGDGLGGALRRLRREHGLDRISAIGGRTTATSLLDDGLVQDLYLTTSSCAGGEPGTPFYVGRRPPTLLPVVTKRSTDPTAPLVFEHLLTLPSLRSSSTPRPSPA